jgi:uncharacterized RDD family membrane protein YckC
MSDQSDRPIGIPGAGLPNTPPLAGLGGATTGGPLGSGPSLRKPIFEAPAPQRLPEGDVGAMVLATWGARFGAWLIDAIIQTVIAVAIAVAIFVAFVPDPFDDTPRANPDDLTHAGAFTLAIIGIYWLIAWIYAPTTMATGGGSTPGKRMAGIRVVSEHGVPLGFGAAVLREIVFKQIVIGIGSLFVLPGLLNYLWPLWDDQARAGHDFMARTRVVKRAA